MAVPPPERNSCAPEARKVLTAEPPNTPRKPPESTVSIAAPPEKTNMLPLLRTIQPLANSPDATAEVWPLLTTVDMRVPPYGPASTRILNAGGEQRPNPEVRKPDPGPLQAPHRPSIDSIP